MDISSSSYYSVSASTNKGISGLASGMDTENMVKQMLTGTQGKIDKQNALKQQATWRQEMYRDIITSINEFQGKYFDTQYGASSANNFASSGFFNSMVSKVTGGNAVRVLSSSSSASVGDIDVIVKQLATNSSLASGKLMSDGKTIEGSNIDLKSLAKGLDKQISLDVAGAGGTKTVKVNLNGANTNDGIVKAFNDQLAADGVTNVTARMYDGRLRLVTSDEATKVTLSSSGNTDKGLAVTGFSSASNTAITGGNMLQGGQVKAAEGISFTMDLDGVQKTITINQVLDTDGKPGAVTTENVTNALKNEVKKAFGSYVEVSSTETVTKYNSDGQILKDDGTVTDKYGNPVTTTNKTEALDKRKTEAKFEFKLNTTGKGHQLSVYGTGASEIGVKAGSSTTFSTSTKLKDLEGIKGNRFRFTIGGQEFTFTGEDSVGTMMNTINNSGAGVKISYSTMTDVFKLESSSSGKEFNLNDVTQNEGNVLGLLFGKSGAASPSLFDEASSYSSKELTVESVTASNRAMEAGPDTKFYGGTSFGFTLDGKSYSVSLAKNNDILGRPIPYTMESAYENIKAQLASSEDIKDAQGNARVELAKDADGNIQLKSKDGSVIRFNAPNIDLDNADAVKGAQAGNLALAFGFGFTTESSSNVATLGTDVNDIFQLKNMNLSGTLSDLAADSTKNVKVENGRLVVNDTSSQDMKDLISSSLAFGTGSIRTNDTNYYTVGRDAELTINGVETTRSSNTFTFDGVTLEATSVSTQKTDGTYEKSTIGTSRDADKIVEGFKSFVEDYNKMIEKLNKYVNAEGTYRKYDPLTSEQKKEMSDNEVELWEEKAKEGLIRNDSDTSTFLSSMRLALYNKPEGNSLALYDIGIETTVDWKSGGKLSINESKLRQALSSDPDGVMNLFTATDGIASEMMSAMKTAANTSSGSPGALVRMAGVAGKSSEKNNTIYNKITTINSRIKELQTKYEKERQRYWNQFNAMEKALSDMNTQSGQLAQFLGG